MSSPSLRFVAVVCALGALTPVAARAACVPASTAASPTAIDQFVGNPNALLTKYPGGEGGLSAEIRNLAVSDGRAVAAISSLIAGANAQQRASIGAGLGQAAMACRRTDVDIARQISTLVVAANNGDLTTAYNGVTGDTRTAATGGGGGGGGGGAGGGGGTGTSLSGGGGGSPYTYSGTSAFTNLGTTFSSGAGTLVTTPGSGSTTLLLQNAGGSASPF